jgi:hypothetical protein
MNTLSIRLRYRPLRVGWCILKDDKEALRKAARLSFTMWGGRYNPIIPVDAPDLANQLLKLFRVDALFPLSEGDAVSAFVAAHKHLPWPLMFDGLFINGMHDVKEPTIVDITHPIIKLHNEFFKHNPTAGPGLDVYRWEPTDPLADVFLCTYGEFPPPEETGVDYASLIQTHLFAVSSFIQNSTEIQSPRIDRETIATLNHAYMKPHYAIQNHWSWPGFYVGDANNATNLINFWNLRATGIEVEFFDPNHAARYERIRSHWAERVRQLPDASPGSPKIALWHQSERTIDDVRQLFAAGETLECRVDLPTWNGMNVRAPIMYFDDSATLASIDESGPTPTMSFALPNKPFVEERDSHNQHYVLSVDPGIGLFRNEQATLHAPFIPQLNTFYGRRCHHSWNAARAEPDSLGVVTSAHDDHETLYALNINELVTEAFGLVGIEATPSKPGLIASTLIQQMGGLDGCRPFKIPGVRSLIENHKPSQSFDRATAMQTIRGQGQDRPLSDYQWLYIEPRKPNSELKNSAVLAYLLERGVFRAGLKFDCPSCRLEFWRSLDDTRSRLECEYCGRHFNATPQLRDKAWAFRRSGLFGNDDHQEGAIPVLLTLQQLLRMRSLSRGMFTTAMTLKPKGASISKCETDFVVMGERNRDHRIQIVIGEAKTRKPFTADDVAKLKAVADAFPKDQYDVFVVFARLATFSAEEVELIKQVNSPHTQRAIMLTDRELEPYFVYERTALEFDIPGPTVTFEGMATATTRVFFEQRRRQVAAS